MKFVTSPLPGAYVIEIEPVLDERGFFARVWCREQFQAAGLSAAIEQSSISLNWKKGTLRGMHYQAVPHEEVKLVWCVRGAIYDVILDLRPDSPTYCQWFAAELNADNGRMMYVPTGFAHGYQTLADESEVFYQVSEAYRPEMAKGVRWNDPVFRIEWPIPNPILSMRDSTFPNFSMKHERLPSSR